MKNINWDKDIVNCYGDKLKIINHISNVCVMVEHSTTLISKRYIVDKNTGIPINKHLDSRYSIKTNKK